MVNSVSHRRIGCVQIRALLPSSHDPGAQHEARPRGRAAASRRSRRIRPRRARGQHRGRQGEGRWSAARASSALRRGSGSPTTRASASFASTLRPARRGRGRRSPPGVRDHVRAGRRVGAVPHRHLVLRRSGRTEDRRPGPGRWRARRCRSQRGLRVGRVLRRRLGDRVNPRTNRVARRIALPGARGGGSGGSPRRAAPCGRGRRRAPPCSASIHARTGSSR